MTLQAAVRGVIDFREARFRDNAWWRRFWLLLAGLANDNNRIIYEAQHRHYLALVGVNSEAIEAANEAYTGLKDTLVFKKTLSESEVRTLTDQWAAAFGDPHDPTVAAEIQRTIDGLRTRGEESEQPDAEAVFTDRLQRRTRGLA